MGASGAGRPRTRLTLHVAIATVAATVLLRGAAPANQDVERAADDVLRDWFSFDTRDLEALGRRRAVVRNLDTIDSREIATVGVVRMRVSPAFYAARLRGIESFAESDVVLQIGTFDAPARIEDLRSLHLEPEFVRELRRCRVHACGIQLPAEGITRIAAAPWGTPAAPAAVTDAIRRVLVDMVRRYQRTGGTTLPAYANDDRSRSVTAEFARMVAEPPGILQRLPRLRQHLSRFPRTEGDGVRDILYWSRARLGPAVVLSITHLALGRPAGAGPIEVAAVSKQLYASKYFDASVGITLVLDRTRRGVAAVDIAYLNRSRVDVFDGVFGRLKRAIARPRVRAGVQRALLAARSRLEEEFSRAPD